MQNIADSPSPVLLKVALNKSSVKKSYPFLFVNFCADLMFWGVCEYYTLK